MDAFEILTKEIDEKIYMLQVYITEGRAETFEEYRRLCGEIKGLSTAKSYALDLKNRMESADE
jgi:hypothetical protein